MTDSPAAKDSVAEGGVNPAERLTTDCQAGGGHRIARIWAADGPLARVLPTFEHRPQQLAMAHAVADALQSKRTLLVEAGTGTGKTMAYLIPAVLSGKKVVVSTGTKALQDQLATNDMPIVEAALGHRVACCVMKGRDNYLCLYRHDHVAPELGGERSQALDRIAQWRETSVTGDRAELAWLADDDPLWKMVSVGAEQCLGATCPQFEPCFFTRLKQRAAQADVVIVNHALFFADLALGPRAAGILPYHTAIVFDEAHALEDVATHHWGVTVGRYRALDLITDLAREPIPSTPSGVAVEEGAAWRTLIEGVRNAIEQQFDALRVQAEGVTGRVTWLPPLGQDEPAMLGHLAETGRRIRAWAALTEGWTRLAERMTELAADLCFLWTADDPGYVFWLESNRSQPASRGHRPGDVRLTASPVDVSQRLRELLFSREAPCILTSATLATGGDYAYIRSRLGIDSADEVTLNSPFDYAKQALLYIPAQLPEPRAPAFAAAATDEILRILAASRGRAFVLCTSRRMLDLVSETCRHRIPYRVFKQGEAPRMTLIERFKAETPSVLFATMGFWQGIDVEGDALSCVIVDKLPFAPPDDPLVQARVSALRQQGEDPFSVYQLPAAAMWLKQGMGRLIRSRRDRGVVCLLDVRVLTRAYGRFFLDSLPSCPVTTHFADLERFFSASRSDGPNGA